MEFSRVQKYLKEIDISSNEKVELETRIAHINEENESMQVKLKGIIHGNSCETCKQLQQN